MLFVKLVKEELHKSLKIPYFLAVIMGRIL